MTMRIDPIDVGSAGSALRDGVTKGTALAPSQHILPTVGKPCTFGTAFAAVILLGATLGLSACGAQQAGAAAIVGGTTISDTTVQSVALQLNPLAAGGQQLTPSIVLVNLILAPYVIAEANRTGKGVSDAAARKVIAKVTDPTRATLDFVKMQLEIQVISQASKNSILAKLEKAKITVNPRYGTFESKQVAIVPITPDWIKTSASSGAK